MNGRQLVIASTNVSRAREELGGGTESISEIVGTHTTCLVDTMAEGTINPRSADAAGTVDARLTRIDLNAL